MTNAVLGVDVGTSGSKGVLVDVEGTVLVQEQRAHRTSSPTPGWFEHDAETVWWNDFVSLAMSLCHRAATPPVGVCVSGIGPCVLPATRDGAPLRAAILYGVDTRAWREIEHQTRRFGKDALLARTGSVLTTQSVGPKLEWLARTEAAVWARTRRLFMCSSYLVYRLTGRYILDHHSASQATPLYDLQAQDWNKDWVAELAPDLELPELRWPGEVVGEVTQVAAQQCGIPAGTPVLAGTIDAWAEAESVGVANAGDCMLMYGTSMFMIAADTPGRPDPRVWTTNGIRPGQRTTAAGMATFGALATWFSELTGRPLGDLADAAAAVPPGAEGLLVLPYFEGERTPIFDPQARGVLMGLTLKHGPAQIYRALLEATAFGVRHNLETVQSAGVRVHRLVAVGGGLRQSSWLQIVSDVLGVQQMLPAVAVGAAYGDAMLAAAATIADAEPLQWPEQASQVNPNEAAKGRYDQLYEMYIDAYSQTASGVHRLVAAQRDWQTPSSIPSPGGPGRCP